MNSGKEGSSTCATGLVIWLKINDVCFKNQLINQSYLREVVIRQKAIRETEQDS